LQPQFYACKTLRIVDSQCEWGDSLLFWKEQEERGMGILGVSRVRGKHWPSCITPSPLLVQSLACIHIYKKHTHRMNDLALSSGILYYPLRKK
jgi:hypothetical protein